MTLEILQNCIYLFNEYFIPQFADVVIETHLSDSSLTFLNATTLFDGLTQIYDPATNSKFQTTGIPCLRNVDANLEILLVLF